MDSASEVALAGFIKEAVKKRLQPEPPTGNRGAFSLFSSNNSDKCIQCCGGTSNV